MTYDTVRSRVVAVGIGTWEWDGASWIQQGQAQPVPSPYSLLAYDSVRERVVAVSNGTWEWDGDQWTQAGGAPVIDRLGMAYDTARQRCVLLCRSLFGIVETWEWDGRTWRLMPSTQAPSSSNGFSLLVFDRARQVVVAITPGSTWDWLGTTWVQRLMPPGPSTWQALAFDVVRSRFVLLDGAATWEFDGTTWTQVLPAHSPPNGGPMAFDAARKRTVLWSDNVWEWNGVDWTVRTASLPAARAHHAMAGDGANQRITMFGGRGRGQRLLGDTWEWDGQQWLLRQPPASPSPRMDHLMAYDSARNRVVLFGGSGLTLFNDTWEWDGTIWTQSLPTSSPPGGMAMAYDAARQNTVLFHGSGTWIWNGTNWTQRALAQQPNPVSGSMAFDNARQRIVYHCQGPAIPLAPETWEWDGINWVRRVTATVPNGLFPATIAYDQARARIISYGDLSFSGQVFEYDGIDWAVTSASVYRRSFPMAYDAVAQRMIAFGGEENVFGSGSPVATTLFYGNVALPAVAALGSGCVGSQGEPRLRSGPPFLGDAAFPVEVVDAAPQAPCFFGLSSTFATTVLGNGCSLYLGNPIDLRFGVTSTQGLATFPLPIPLTPALRGVVGFGQAAVLDAGGAFAGLAFTAGRRFVVGD